MACSLEEARAELETINRRLEDGPIRRRIAAWFQRWPPTRQMNSGPDAPIIWGSLWAAAWFVLLIACANLANLTLVRTMGRWREFSTRIALGAGQGRMMRQMLMESLMLAGVAAALGWWITDVERAHVGGGHGVPLPGPRLHRGFRHARLSGGDLRRRGDLVFAGADRQGRAAGRERRAEGRRPRRHAGAARQTPGGGTGGWPDGAGHRAALGRRRPGAELRERLSAPRPACAIPNTSWWARCRLPSDKYRPRRTRTRIFRPARRAIEDHSRNRGRRCRSTFPCSVADSRTFEIEGRPSPLGWRARPFSS